jgi:hypothetical protein
VGRGWPCSLRLGSWLGRGRGRTGPTSTMTMRRAPAATIQWWPTRAPDAADTSRWGLPHRCRASDFPPQDSPLLRAAAASAGAGLLFAPRKNRIPEVEAGVGVLFILSWWGSLKPGVDRVTVWCGCVGGSLCECSRADLLAKQQRCTTVFGNTTCVFRLCLRRPMRDIKYW